MPTYVTRIRKDSGETVEQLLSVPEEELTTALARLDGFVLACEPYEPGRDAGRTAQPTVSRSRPGAPATESRPGAGPAARAGDRRVRSRPADLVSFTWYLYTLVHAGVPLARALQIVRGQLEDPAWQRVLGSLLTSLEKGETLADSLGRFPRFFPTHFVHLIEVGELAGNLDQVLLELATYYEKQMENRARMRGALAYPALLIGACTVVVFFLVAFVLPRIARMFVNMNIEMPWITSMLLDLSDFLRATLPLWAGLLLTLPIALGLARRSPAGRRFLARLALGLPLFGLVYRKFVMARFCQTLALLQRSGVSILVGLDLARQGLGNVVLMDFLRGVEQNLREGAALGEELARSPYVPPMVSSMIAVGEESGRLTEMLSNVARFYERDIDQLVKTLPKMIEPTIIVLMTGIVGLLAASIFIPLSQLTQGVG